MLSQYEARRKVSVRREVQSRLWNTEGRETCRRSITPGDRLPSGFCDLLLHVDRVVLKAVATEVVGIRSCYRAHLPPVRLHVPSSKERD